VGIHEQQGNLISILLFSENKESTLKIKRLAFNSCNRSTRPKTERDDIATTILLPEILHGNKCLL
jgi:hypothetical protein